MIAVLKAIALPVNKKIVEKECAWCDAHNEPHSPACPMGERYRHVQSIGGVPCGSIVVELA